MNKMCIPIEELKQHIAERRALNDTAKKFHCCANTVFYALKRAGLRSNGRKFTARVLPVCAKCGCTDPKRFNKRKGHGYEVNPNGVWCAWCIPCTSTNVNEYKQRNRARTIEFLGGKCVVCGFSKYSAALDVHHVDPAKKDQAANTMIGWRWERLQKELEGCVLLCSNCHRGHHSGELSPEDEAQVRL
jgi:5-methylcytosine-specific restriction endonuclease McrA